MSASGGGSNAVFNFNIGLVGHVDSGKTSLAKALSTTQSTAAFDKNPQSQARGITLDLGFSSFQRPITETLVAKDSKLGDFSGIQFTLVDCPGHASLLKTVIGGASIIDAFILVIDITKGIQTQTAECLIVAEITKPGNMLIVLNKLDLVPEPERVKKVDVTTKRLRKTLENTSFSQCPIVPLSATNPSESDNMTAFNEKLESMIYYPARQDKGNFLFSIDHCFSLRGQGTVMTGTALCGSAAVGDSIEIPSLKEVRKIKSMQQFKKPITKIKQGDRAGLCVAQFDSALLERSIVCTPGTLPQIYGALASVSRIAFYKHAIASKTKLHFSVGHETALAKCTFFTDPATSSDAAQEDNIATRAEFDFGREYAWAQELAPVSELRKENMISEVRALCYKR